MTTNRSILKAAKISPGIALVFLYIFVPLIFKLISPVFILAGLGSYTDIIMPSLLVIGMLLSLRYFVSCISMKDLLFYLLFAIILVLSPLFYPLSESFVHANFTIFIFQVVPYFFFGLSLRYSRNYDIFWFVARMGLLVQLFWQFCLLIGLADIQRADDGSLGEQMGIAYGFLFSLFLEIIYSIEEKKKIDIILSIIGSIMLFLMGARGPIIIYMFFVAGYLIVIYDFKKNNLSKKIFVGIITAFIISVSNSLLRLLLLIAISLGFSTRVFDSIMDNEMFDIEKSSYRDDFYYGIWSKIIDDPTYMGYGFGSDRLFTPNGIYTHNFELEILCQFGLVGGGLILLCLLILFLKCFFRLKGTKEVSFWFALLCCGWGALQLSHSYISYPLFFVLLGYCVSVLRNSTKQKKIRYAPITS